MWGGAGGPPPSSTDCPRGTCPLDYAPRWAGWGRFYHGSSAAFGGRELCDCGRVGGKVQELRLYHNPDAGVRVSYVFRTGTIELWHHSLSGLGEGCLAEAHAGARAAAREGSPPPPAARPCTQGLCKPGACLSAPGIRKVNQYAGFTALAASLRPDLVVVNVGHWTRGDAGKLVDLGRALRKGPSSPGLVWATTTANAPSSKLLSQDKLEAALEADGWRMWHARAATVPLRAVSGGKGKGGGPHGGAQGAQAVP